ncbi:hypothetical protein QYM36_014338, partial [Artemia franciscana]
ILSCPAFAFACEISWERENLNTLVLGRMSIGVPPYQLLKVLEGLLTLLGDLSSEVHNHCLMFQKRKLLLNVAPFE